MPRLLQYGLIATGSGIAVCSVGLVSGGAGPCSGITVGVLAMMAGTCWLSVGVLLSISAGVVAIINRKPKPAR